MLNFVVLFIILWAPPWVLKHGLRSWLWLNLTFRFCRCVFAVFHILPPVPACTWRPHSGRPLSSFLVPHPHRQWSLGSPVWIALSSCHLLVLLSQVPKASLLYFAKAPGVHSEASCIRSSETLLKNEEQPGHGHGPWHSFTVLGHSHSPLIHLAARKLKSSLAWTPCRLLHKPVAYFVSSSLQLR